MIWGTEGRVGLEAMRAAAFGVVGVEGCVGRARGGSRNKPGNSGSLKSKPGLGSGVGEGAIEVSGMGAGGINIWGFGEAAIELSGVGDGATRTRGGNFGGGVGSDVGGGTELI